MYEMRPNFSFSRSARFQEGDKTEQCYLFPESFEGACDRPEPLDLLDLIPEQSTLL